jgi:hypothetical protein
LRITASKNQKIEDKEDDTMKTTQFGTLQIAIILLTVATAVIHLSLGIPNGLTMFILNGIGYLGLLVAHYLPQLRAYQNYTRWALIGFTALTILAWAVVTKVDLTNPIGVITKLIEVTLIVCLVLEGRR